MGYTWYDFVGNVGVFLLLAAYLLLQLNKITSNRNTPTLTKLLDTIQLHPLQISKTRIPITVSIGYCTELGSTLDEMINNADTALYEAKENGRNQIVWRTADQDERSQAQSL